MFTVSRLGLHPAPRMDPLKLEPGRAGDQPPRTTNRKVVRWRDGRMVLRCTAVGSSTPSGPSAVPKVTSGRPVRRLTAPPCPARHDRRAARLPGLPPRAQNRSPPKYHETRDTLLTWSPRWAR